MKMATISNYKKHLKLSERIKIESSLNNDFSFRTISKDINKIISTIAREIKNCRYKEKGNYFNDISKKCLKFEKASFVYNGCPNEKNVGKINFITVFPVLKKIIKNFLLNLEKE
ncbi:MAG: helix-turn-helix domain-containing protein [Bacilli bacterium]